LLTRIKMRAFSDAHRKAFENLVRAISIKEQFCGIFTPDVSELFYDGDVMIVELTSYLKPGMESKIAKLAQVSLESPKVHEERISQKEHADRAITDMFLRNVERGMPIAVALKTAIETQEAVTPAVVRPPPVAPTPPALPPTLPPTEKGPTDRKAAPPTVEIKAEPETVEAVIDDKIAALERAAKDKAESAEAPAENLGAAKGKKARKSSKRLKKAKGGKDSEEGGEEETAPPTGPSVEPAPPTVAPTPEVAPAMDDAGPEMTPPRPEDVSAGSGDGPGTPEADQPVVIRPPPAITEDERIDIKIDRPSKTGTGTTTGLGGLMSRLKGVDLEKPDELKGGVPKVPEMPAPVEPSPEPTPPLRPEPITPVPEPEQPGPAPPPDEPEDGEEKAEAERPKEGTTSGFRIPPPPSLSDTDVSKPATPKKDEKAGDKPKKSGESGLDELMKKLRAGR